MQVISPFLNLFMNRHVRPLPLLASNARRLRKVNYAEKETFGSLYRSFLCLAVIVNYLGCVIMASTFWSQTFVHLS